jgi:hypothetical protein
MIDLNIGKKAARLTLNGVLVLTSSRCCYKLPSRSRRRASR